jgi:hypothetical protein
MVLLAILLAVPYFVDFLKQSQSTSQTKALDKIMYCSINTADYTNKTPISYCSTRLSFLNQCILLAYAFSVKLKLHI